jgi:hypothetical protein
MIDDNWPIDNCYMVISRCIQTSGSILLMVDSKWETHIVGLEFTGVQTGVNCFGNPQWRQHLT